MGAYFYILSLAFLPLIYKLSFWLYVVQLKEYRWDRFKEYLLTPQGKKALFNSFFFLELFVLIIGILSFNKIIDFKITYYSIVFLLQIESLYVFYKIFTLKFIVPKKTGRILILSSVILFHLILSAFWGYFHQNQFVYMILPSLLAFMPAYVMFWNIITGVFFDYMKEKIFQKAEQKLKNYYNLKKIGITGSYGKSSMKEYLVKILEKKYKVIKTPENINTEIGISNFILSTDFKNYDYFVVETGAYRKGEIQRVGQIINHKDAFLTGIGNQHIGLFGGQQNIIDAKFEIGKKVLENNGKLYLNKSNLKEFNENTVWIQDKLEIINFKGKTPSWVKELIKNNQIITYGSNNADYNFEILEISTNGTKFNFVNYKNGSKINFYSPFVLGPGQIENLTGAIAYAIENGLDQEQIQKSLLEIKNPKKTLEIKVEKDNPKFDVVGDNKEIILIDDTYNLSVNGLLNAINLLDYFKGEKILVVDDILELGKSSKQIHKKLGKYIAGKVDKILYLGINFKEDFITGLKEGNFKGEILKSLPLVYNPNTIILFEGKKAGYLLK